MAWPIGISMISMTLKSAIDMIMVGRLGAEALAAVGFAGMVAWNLGAGPMGMLRGQRPLVSQYLGAGDRKAAFEFGAHGFYLALAFSFLMLGLSPWAHVAMDWATGTTGITKQAGVLTGDYLQIRMEWTGPWLMTVAVGEYLRSVGRPRVAMVADLICHPLNVLLSWCFIFGKLGFPEMGVRGAALGTGIADLVAMVVMFQLARPKGKLTIPKFQWLRMKRVLSTGITGGVQFSLESISYGIITYFVARLGTVPLAVHQIGITLIHLAMMPCVAVADGASVLVGQYTGEKQWDGVRRAVRSGFQIMLPFAGFMALVYWLGGEFLVGLFVPLDDPNYLESISLGAGLLIAAAIWQIGDVFQFSYRFSLRATGDHKWVMWVGILVSWILSVPLAWWVVEIMHGTVIHVWMAWNAEIYFGSWLFYRRWKSGKWKDKRLVQDG